MFTNLLQVPHALLCSRWLQDEAKEIRGECERRQDKRTQCSYGLLRFRVVFQGGRDVSDFISYLKREATNPLVMQEEPKKKKKKKKDDEKVEL